MAAVRYLVNDLEKAVAFYTGSLNFKLDYQMGPAFASVSKDELTIWLSGPQSSAAKAMPDGRKPEPGGWNRLVIEVPNLVELVESLKQGGLHFRNEIVIGPGGKQIVLDDPSGNPIELFEPAE